MVVGLARSMMTNQIGNPRFSGLHRRREAMCRSVIVFPFREDDAAQVLGCWRARTGSASWCVEQDVAAAPVSPSVGGFVGRFHTFSMMGCDGTSRRLGEICRGHAPPPRFDVLWHSSGVLWMGKSRLP